MNHIIVKGAREHNLKNIDVEIPRGRLVVLTGLSGSGKSSLAFDTIYAEGQRRYVESLSAYARQFLEQMSKPDIDSIEGLSPAISIEQRGTSKNPRSTVGTITEIYDYLRLLYARVGHVYCWSCGERIQSMSPQEIVDHTLELPEGSRFSIVAPVVRQEKGDFAAELKALRRDGYHRIAIDDELVDLSGGVPKLDGRKLHSIEVYVDRLVLKEGIRGRLTDSVELALRLTGGLVTISPLEGDDLLFSTGANCPGCGVEMPKLEPKLFSFNNPRGACPGCDGIGYRMHFDPDRVVPDPALSLRDGAIEPWEKRNAPFFQSFLESLAAHYKIDMDKPWKSLTKKIQKAILYGSGKEEIEFVFERNGRRSSYTKAFEGVLANLERRLSEVERRRREEGGVDDDAVYDEYHRYMATALCEDCGGTRLRKEARHVKIGGAAVYEVTCKPIGDALAFVEGLELSEREQTIAERVLREVRDRLQFLVNVGLDYLTLDRPSGTLSGGEGQRIRLATQIGSSLVGVLYILDEPSIGLHQRDNDRLLETLTRLRDQGNTVLVVEHDEDTIRAADHIIDMGPRAGDLGGRIVASGTVKEIESHTTSLTGAYLSGRKAIDIPAKRRQPGRQWVSLKGCTQNNLGGVNVRFPVGLFTCVTGVSGSGKSTLVIDTLQAALQAKLHRSSVVPGEHASIDGVQHVDKVIDIDQSPIGRTPRSNPATYTGVLTHIRDLFAELPDAKARGYRPGRFSFNVKGGRCESCQGDGVIRIEMHFLPDVYVRCDACQGRRYNRETLEVSYKGKNIADVLDMTVAQAADFLGHVPKIKQKLSTIREVGLGYITLGQAATTLSGGEAQRLKLSKELARKATGNTMYILDEPTTGLHFDDIKQLLDVLEQLAESGNTVVVIEHNLDVIKTADWVIDLGPEGGSRGGQVVAEGTPEEIARSKRSHTGRYLKRVL